jgi:hypothetical protein
MQVGQAVQILVAVNKGTPRFEPGVIEGGQADADGAVRYTVRREDGRLFERVHPASMLVLVTNAEVAA